MNTRIRAFTFVLGLVAAAPVMAQHGHHHTDWYRNQVIISPQGHRLTDHHTHYQHVVPSYGNYQGNYYTHDKSHYYYPQTVSNQNGVQVQRISRPVVIQFGSFSHVDDLASRIEFLCNEFCLDLHYNYQHNPGFAETYREAYQLLQASKAAHASEHRQDRVELARIVGEMDPLFHHLEEDVEPCSRHHHRQIGNLGIIDKMQQIESTIHHLLYDVGVEPQHHDGDHEEAPAPGGGVEQAPPPAP